MDERWYTSTRIRSMYPVAYLTGRIEARIKMPSGLGLWGAFWMLPANSSRGTWPSTGEIDIIEVSSFCRVHEDLISAWPMSTEASSSPLRCVCVELVAYCADCWVDTLSRRQQTMPSRLGLLDCWALGLLAGG